jgi:hypothetical protein
MRREAEGGIFRDRGGILAGASRDVPESQWNIRWNILCIRCGPQYVAVAPGGAPKKSSEALVENVSKESYKYMI